MATYSELRDRVLYWAECVEPEVPVDDLWLTPQEQLRLDSLKVPKRRVDWRLGRWTAKSAVRGCLHLGGQDVSPSDVEIRVRPSGAPYAFIRGDAINLSLSHSHGVALCIVSHSTALIGCDVERVESRNDAFIRDYLTAFEKGCVSECTDETQKHILVTLFWSAKESALKALQLGLRSAVAQVNVHGDLAVSSSGFSGCLTNGWRRLEVSVAKHRKFYGWWSQSAGFIKTIVCGATEKFSTLEQVRIATPADAITGFCDGCRSSKRSPL